MASGTSPSALIDDARRTARSALAGGDIRFEGAEERPLGAKGRRTRALVLRAAGEAFSEGGWSATSMATIAQRAGVGTGTIYQYFRAKDDILVALVGRSTLAALDQIRAWDPSEGPDGLRGLIDRFVVGYAMSAPFQRVWEEVSLTDPRLAALRSELSDVYVTIFAEAFIAGRAAGLLDPGPSPEETARALCAMVDRYCHQVFVQHAAELTPTAVADLITGIWVAALRLH
ncbi:MAG: TetR/AcrR family transcriptional regulator [Acidimicrobiales bacterium]